MNPVPKNTSWGSLARRISDPAVVSLIPTTAHVVNALLEHLTYIFSVHPSAKWVPGNGQLIAMIIVICGLHDS